MLCEVYRGSKRVAGPFDYNPQVIREIAVRNGIDPNLVPGAISGGTKIGAHMFVKGIVSVKPVLGVDNEYYLIDRVEGDSMVTMNYGVREMTIDKLVSNRKAALRAAHVSYRSQRALYRGIMIAHDEKAKADAFSLMDAFRAEWATPTNWRGKVVSDVTAPGGVPIGLESDTITINNTAEAEAMYKVILTRYAGGYAARSHVEALIDATAATGIRSDVAAINPRAEFANTVAAALVAA